MDASVIGSIISGAASLASAGISAGSAATANRRSYKWSKKYFDYQNEYNLENYSPAAVMQRFRDAGINPHEITGNIGSSSAVGSMSVPEYQNPVDPLAKALPAAINMAMDIYQRKKSIENQSELVQSQVKKNQADAARTNYQVANILPYQSVYEKNRQAIPLYQIEAYGWQNRKTMMDIANLGLQQQKYQLAIDLMKIEKEYREDYLKFRNDSVKWDSLNKQHQAGISGLDLHNYQTYGLRPQDPYYTRVAANLTDVIENEGLSGLWTKFKNFFKR